MHKISRVVVCHSCCLCVGMLCVWHRQVGPLRDQYNLNNVHAPIGSGA